MELKCKACNNKLSFFDYTTKCDSGKEEDLCSYCRDIVYLSENDELDIKEYQHQHITESWKSFTKYEESS